MRRDPQQFRVVLDKGNGELARKPRKPTPPAKTNRRLDALRQQHDAMLQSLKQAGLLVLAERDLRAREAAQIKAALSAV